MIQVSSTATRRHVRARTATPNRTRARPDWRRRRRRTEPRYRHQADAGGASRESHSARSLRGAPACLKDFEPVGSGRLRVSASPRPAWAVASRAGCSMQNHGSPAARDPQRSRRDRVRLSRSVTLMSTGDPGAACLRACCRRARRRASAASDSHGDRCDALVPTSGAARRILTADLFRSRRDRARSRFRQCVPSRPDRTA